MAVMKAYQVLQSYFIIFWFSFQLPTSYPP